MKKDEFNKIPNLDDLGKDVQEQLGNLNSLLGEVLGDVNLNSLHNMLADIMQEVQEEPPVIIEVKESIKQEPIKSHKKTRRSRGKGNKDNKEQKEEDDKE